MLAERQPGIFGDSAALQVRIRVSKIRLAPATIFMLKTRRFSLRIAGLATPTDAKLRREWIRNTRSASF